VKNLRFLRSITVNKFRTVKPLKNFNMNEYLLLIKNDIREKDALTGENHLKFIQECEQYIAALKKEKRLIAAQPLHELSGVITVNGKGMVEEEKNNNRYVGYYHVYADNHEEAMEVAQRNPEFKYKPSATIEIRAVKVKEKSTGFKYPTGIGTCL
jgi:hypothetical protein